MTTTVILLLGLAGGDDEERKQYDWLNKIWLLITGSLHDDLYRKVNHVKRGMLPGLLAEIAHALVVSNLEEVPSLRLELYGGSMSSTGCDLQNWINFISERQSKLSFLEHAVAQPELVAIFLKGLHPVFQQLQVYFSIPGNMPTNFDAAVAIVRKFASSPVITMELAKLKTSGLSQAVFTMAAQEVKTTSTPQPTMCKLFARTGQCRFGAKCKFVHTTFFYKRTFKEQAVRLLQTVWTCGECVFMEGEAPQTITTDAASSTTQCPSSNATTNCSQFRCLLG